MNSRRIITFVKCMIFACILSGIGLLVFSLLWFLFPKADFLCNIGKILMYSLSCFFCGLIFSKEAKSKKYLWGMLIGLCYDLLLVFLSLLVHHGTPFQLSNPFLTSMFLCPASGMLGGMLQKQDNLKSAPDMPKCYRCTSLLLI